MKKLNHEENRFFDRLADRELPEPDEASREAILAHAAAHATEETSTTVRRPSLTGHRKPYRQRTAVAIAVGVVLAVLGISLWNASQTGPAPNDTIDPQEPQVAHTPVEKPQPLEIVVEDPLDPMEFDDIHGLLTVSSTNRKIDAFWDEDPWRGSSPPSTVDQHLSSVRHRIEQLKKRSEFDELYKNEPEKNEGGQLDVLETSRYVWFDTPWYLFDRDA
ncbi:MAG: hypothetical protein PVH19_11090 [Planctomycetia bacterium]|jgi:hypothetical protein